MGRTWNAVKSELRNHYGMWVSVAAILWLLVAALAH